MGEDCGEGLAILLCSKDSSLFKNHFLKVRTISMYESILNCSSSLSLEY